MPDIDIDFADRDSVLSVINHRTAALPNGKKHNTGIYVTEIPFDPLTNIASIDYKTAEERGYFKLDFLNVSIYKDVKDEEHLNHLMEKEPLWELLEHKDFVDLLFHLSGHTNICQILKPKNIEDLAAVLAIIRPAKRYLLNKDWETIRKEVWIRPNDNEYYFKKAHAISYAVAVVVHMNLLCEKLKDA
jgi:hypothetical protein